VLLTVCSELPSINVSGRGLIFLCGRLYFVANLESTKQSDEPESTRACTSTGNREERREILRERKLTSATAPSVGGGSWVVVMQSALREVS